MDKRFIPLAPVDQVQKRQAVIATIRQNPDWTIHQISRYIRTELRLTLPEMAKVCKVSIQTLQKIEAEQGNPTLQTVEKILKPFGFKLQIVYAKDNQ